MWSLLGGGPCWTWLHVIQCGLDEEVHFGVGEVKLERKSLCSLQLPAQVDVTMGMVSTLLVRVSAGSSCKSSFHV